MARFDRIKKLVKDGFFGWENVKWFLRNIQATFSNQPSYFARKRIESFILFINASTLLDLFCIKHWASMTSPEMLAIYAAQMVYAGYQVTQIRKDMTSNPPVISIPKPDAKEAETGKQNEGQ